MELVLRADGLTFISRNGQWLRVLRRWEGKTRSSLAGASFKVHFDPAAVLCLDVVLLWLD